MAFDEVRFPDSIAQGSSSGPSFKTNIADSASGSEGRTSVWSKGRLTFDIAYGIHKAVELAQVIAFFRACAGKARGFRFKDYSDYTSASDGVSSPAFTDQLIGEGTGSTNTFQLTKTYSSGDAAYTRNITKPVSGTVTVGIDGTQTTSFTVDTTTGIVTLSSYPSSGALITAGFEFDVPVRFKDDNLSISLQHIKSGSASIELTEVRI